MPVFPAIEEAKVGGSWPKDNLGQKWLYLKKNNESKKGWECGSSGIEPPEKAWGPKYKPQ
jgi:hypothetical protein